MRAQTTHSWRGPRGRKIGQRRTCQAKSGVDACGRQRFKATHSCSWCGRRESRTPAIRTRTRGPYLGQHQARGAGHDGVFPRRRAADRPHATHGTAWRVAALPVELTWRSTAPDRSARRARATTRRVADTRTSRIPTTRQGSVSGHAASRRTRRPSRCRCCAWGTTHPWGRWRNLNGDGLGARYRIRCDIC